MVFVVLGMHKSGTTLVSEILHRSGIDMGVPDGGAGYDDGNKAERESPKQLNKALLQESTDSLSSYQRWIGSLESVPELANQARAMVVELENEDEDWGFKDPRTCLTLEFWREVLPAESLYLIVYRHPAEVVRHYLPYHPVKKQLWKPVVTLRALRAWYYYNQQLLQEAEASGGQAAVFEFRSLMSDEREFARLGRFCRRQLKDMRKPHLVRKEAHKGICYTIVSVWLSLTGRSISQTWKQLESLRSHSN